MKQFSIALILITIGFYGGYFLNDYLLNSNLTTSNRHFSQSSGKSMSSSGITLQTTQENGVSSYLRGKDLLVFDGIAVQASVFAQLRFAFELANQASTQELESYLEESIKSQDPLYHYNIVTIFFEAYTVLNPLAAISFVEKNPRFPPENFIAHIVTSWVRHDPEAAIDYFMTLSNKRLIQSLGARLLQEPSLISGGMLSEIAAKMGPRPDQIIENARLRSLSPEEAFNEAQYLNGMARTKQMQISVSRWMRTNPEEAINRISNMINKQERSRLLQLAYSEFASREPLSALAHLREHHADNENLEQTMLAYYAQQDVKGALPLIEEFVQRTGKKNAMSSLLAIWMQTDPSASLAYAETLDEQQKLDAYRYISNSYQQSDPEAGLAWALGLGPKYREISENAARRVQAHSIDAAEALLDSLSDIGIREILFASIARTKAQGDPEGALQWLEKYEDEPAYNSALQNVIMSWSGTDPQAAANALDSFSGPAQTGPLVAQIAQQWFRVKPQEALKWIDSRPAGEGKYTAISSIALMIGRTDSETALELISDLPTERQEQAKMNLAYTMMGRNTSQVEDIIRTLELNESDAKRIRGHAKQMFPGN